MITANSHKNKIVDKEKIKYNLINKDNCAQNNSKNNDLKNKVKNLDNEI